MPIRVVLFDIDGTLVDSNEQHVTAWGLAFAEAGQPQELGDIRAQIGKGGDLLVPALLPQADKAAIKRIADEHGRLFKAMYLDHIRPFPGATDLLHRVRESGRKLVLASSAKQDEIDFYCKLLGVKGLIDATTSIDDVDTSKPAPDIFATALVKIGVEADAALAIGDTPYDIEAAGQAGIVSIGVTSGPFSDGQLRDAGAIAVFAGVAALLQNYDKSPLAS